MKLFNIYMKAEEIDLPDYNMNETPAIEIIKAIAESRDLNKRAQEVLLFAGFDRYGRVIGISELNIGTATGIHSSIKEILQAALLCNADSIALLHNHPSGTAVPSEQDKRRCKEIINAAQSIDIDLIEDAVIDFEGNITSTLNHVLLGI